MLDTEDLGKLHPRRENRMVAVQCLYAWDLTKPEDLRSFFASFFTTQTKPREFFQFAETLARSTIEHIAAIDAIIQEYTQNWKFNRIAKVDLAILRLAIYELLYRRDIPPVVSINEALDIAGVFSHPDAKRFINGILDRFKETLGRPFRTAAEN